MKIEAHALTDLGNKKKQNEDFHIVDAGLNLFIVCDGVSGNLAGEQASRIAATTIRKVMQENKSAVERHRNERTLNARGQLSAALLKAIDSANAQVCDLSISDPTKRGMATTVDALLISHDQAFLAHVGDSRIYLIRQGRIHQLTEDHTVAAEMRKQGTWTEEEARKSPFAHTLTRAIGMQQYIPVDILQ